MANKRQNRLTTTLELFYLKFKYLLMNSNENELRLIYLAFELIIVNIVFGIIYFISPVLPDLSSHERSLYLLLFNISEFITFSIFSRKNLYFHDSFSNRVKRISNRILSFSILLFVFAHLFLPPGFSHIFLLKYILLLYTLFISQNKTRKRILRTSRSNNRIQ